MAGYSLDQLIEAIAGAVVEAEAVVRDRQVANLQTYFEADGTPKILTFRIPRPGETQATDADVLQAPVLSFVPVTSLAIKEMEISFSTELGSVDPEPAQPLRTPVTKTAAGAATPITVAGMTLRTASLNIAPPANTPANSPSVANIQLRVKASDPPEGLARLIDRLNKGI